MNYLNAGSETHGNLFFLFCFIFKAFLLMLFAAEPLNLGLGGSLGKYFLNVK